ncbi:MAG: tape measure protein [Sinimarinibacterium flocculans]|uniref:tape measure protein n=1 Tax=Sinimarinibacterium flocculans TaxID=985250 RepID=UPI003C431776
MTDVAELGFRADSSSLRTAAKDLDRVSGAARRTENAASRMERQIQAGFRALQGTFAALGVGAAVRQIIAIDDAYARVEGRLRLVTTGTENLARVQEELFGIAQRTGVAYEETANLYAKVAKNAEALGLSQQQLLDFTEVTNQAIQVSGASAIEAAGGVRQLGQALASGALRGDEFNSLAENMPRLRDAIADGLGISIGELRKFAAEGKLTAEVVTQALLSQSDVIEREFQALPVTVGRAMTELENEVKRAIAGADTGPLVDSIRDLREIIADPATQQGLQNFASGLIGIATAAAKVASLIGNVAVFIGEEFAARAQGASLEDVVRVGEELERVQKRLNFEREKTVLIGKEGHRQTIAALEAEEAALKGKYATAQKQAEERARALANAGLAAAEAAEIVGKKSEDAAGGVKALTDAEQKAIDKLKERIGIEKRVFELVQAGRTVEDARFVAAYETANELERRQMVWEKAVEGQEDAAKAARAAEEELVKKAKEATDEIIRQQQQRAEQIQRAYERIAAGVEDVFRDLYRSAFDGFEGFEDQLKSSFENLLVELALIATRNQIIIPVVQQFGGAFGLSQSSIGGITQALGLGDESPLSLIFSGAGEQLGEHAIEVMEREFPGIGKEIGEQAGAGILQQLGQIGAVAAGLFQIGSSFTAPNSRFSPEQQGIAAVATFGYSLPATILDNLTGGGLFGTRWHTVGQELAISIQDQIADATLQTIRERERSLWRGTDRDVIEDGAYALDRQLSEAFGLIYDSIADGAARIGLAAGSFRFQFDQSIAGLSEDEVSAVISGALSDATDSFIRQTVPGIEQMRRAGESLQETFGRLVTGFEVVQSAIDMFGLSTTVRQSVIDATNGVNQFFMVFAPGGSIEDVRAARDAMDGLVQATPEIILRVADALTELAGSAEQLQANISNFWDDFASDEQKLDRTRQLVTQLFADLDMAVPGSREQVFALVQGLNIFTEAGREAFSAITQSSDLLDSFFDAMENRARSLASEFATLDQRLTAATGDDLLAERTRAVLRAAGRSNEQINRVLAEMATQAERAAVVLNQRLTLEQRLAEATGNAALAESVRLATLAQQRAALDESTRALFDQVVAAEAAMRAEQQLAAERQRLAALQIRLAQAMGDEVGATALRRQQELAEAATDAERALLLQIYAAEDAAAAARAASVATVEYAQAIRDMGDAVAEERERLETQLLQVIGATAELRRREREEMDASNRALYDQVNALRDQRAAVDETVRTYSELATGIGNFADSINLAANDAVGISLSAARSQFEEVARRARLGDVDALQSFTTVGEQLRMASAAQAMSQVEYMRDLARLRNETELAEASALRQVDLAEASFDELARQSLLLAGIQRELELLRGVAPAQVSTPSLTVSPAAPQVVIAAPQAPRAARPASASDPDTQRILVDIRRLLQQLYDNSEEGMQTGVPVRAFEDSGILTRAA